MIVVNKVSKYYGAHPAVRELDFTIEQGECVGFLGLNGAGKSTTLRLLSCLLLPTSGRVTIRGLDVEERPHEIRRFLGFLPETPPVYPEMTVCEFLRFAGQLRGMAHAAIKKRLPEVLDVCDIGSVADQVIATLSHGYRQRVGIAQAIVHDPALLILDEPIQGLDPVQIVEMRKLIRGLRGKHTILLSTHILSEIEKTCDRILMLHRGTIAAHGTEDELTARFAGRGTIDLLVVGSAAAVRDALAKVAGVSDVSVEAVTEAGTVRATVTSDRDVRANVAKAIVESRLDLVGLERTISGLEGIFVDLSRGGLTETQHTPAAGGAA